MLVDSLLENDALGLLVHRLAAFDEKVSGCACRAVQQEGAKGLLLRIAHRTGSRIPCSGGQEGIPLRAMRLPSQAPYTHVGHAHPTVSVLALVPSGAGGGIRGVQCAGHH